MTNNYFERNLVFFLAGAFLGSAAVALSTPYTGRRLRRIISHKAMEVSEQVAEVKESLLETGNELLHKGEKLVKDAEKIFA